MSTTASETAGQPAKDFTKSWRYKAGFGLIVFGHVILVLGLVSPALGIGAGTAAAMILAGEVISMVSIVLLGKDGFMAIKSKLFGFLKAGFAGPVGRTRHRIGIALLCTNVVTAIIVMIYAWSAFGAAMAEEPTFIVWDLAIEQQASLVFWLFLIGELSFLVAIYTLGADWWDRFRALFVWQPAEG